MKPALHKTTLSRRCSNPSALIVQPFGISDKLVAHVTVVRGFRDDEKLLGLSFDAIGPLDRGAYRVDCHTFSLAIGGSTRSCKNGCG